MDGDGAFLSNPEGDNENDNIKVSKTKGGKLFLIISIIIILVLFSIFVIIMVSSGDSEKSQDEKTSLKDINSGYPTVLPNDTEYTYIPIISTNDIHGFVFPRIVEINSTLNYKKAGIEYFAKYLEILRKVFGENRVIWLDGGDQHTGGVELTLSNNEIMTDFMNEAKITAATIGNHEFDLDYDFFRNKIKKSNFPYLSANVYDNNTHEFHSFENGTSESNGHKQYIIKEISLTNGDIIKIGILGVGPIMSYEAGENYLDSEKWKNLEFKGIAETITEQVKEMKEKYKDLNSIIATIHAGSLCGKNMTLNLYTKETPQIECTLTDELTEALNSIEKGLLDAVVGGDLATLMHHWINDIPVISGLDNGQYTNILYLPFKKIDGKYQVVKNQVKIEGPLPNCEKIFNSTKICANVLTEDDYIKQGPLVEFSYRGIKMEKASYMSLIYDKYFSNYKEYNENEVCRLFGLNSSIIEKDFSGDGYVINLVTDIIKNKTKADFCIFVSGDLRTTWNMGKITKADIYSMLPFKNYLCTATMTGADLKNILSIIQKGKKSYYPTSGLKQIIKIFNDTKELKEVKMWVDGKETDIEDDKEYIFGTNDYIINDYGDDFADVKKEGYIFQNVNCEKGDESLLIASIVEDALRKFGTIDISKYVDPLHPRLIEEISDSNY